MTPDERIRELELELEKIKKEKRIEELEQEIKDLKEGKKYYPPVVIPGIPYNPDPGFIPGWPQNPYGPITYCCMR